MPRARFLAGAGRGSLVLRRGPLSLTLSSRPSRYLHPSASLLHFRNCGGGVSRLKVYSSDGILQNGDLQTGGPRIEHRMFHAVVSGESANVEMRDLSQL